MRKCVNCSHNWDLHHYVNGKFVCDGESFPCPCVRDKIPLNSKRKRATRGRFAGE